MLKLLRVGGGLTLSYDAEARLGAYVNMNIMWTWTSKARCFRAFLGSYVHIILEVV